MAGVAPPSASYALDEKELSEHSHHSSHKCNSEEVKDFAAIDSDNELPPEEVGDKIDIVFDKSVIKEIMTVSHSLSRSEMIPTKSQEGPIASP